MLSNSAVVNDLSSVRPGTAARHAVATFYSSGRYSHVRKRLDRTRTAAVPVARSAVPEVAPVVRGEEQSLHRLLLDEVESVNRLYRVVSQAGCEILF